jgi:hypothetical protein
MIKLLPIIETIGFLLQEDGSYIGYGVSNEKLEQEIKFIFRDHYLLCIEGDRTLFSLIYANLSVGTFLVLCQEYGIVNYDFISQKLKQIPQNFEN